MKDKLLSYFHGDDLAANVWKSKYAQEGEITPDDMHKRMAKEFARIENDYFDAENAQGYITKDVNLSKYGRERRHLTEDSIYQLFKNFKYIVPQGSIMAQLGSKFIGSLSNCFVIGQPEDSYGGIMLKDQEQVQLMKRRGGVGQDVSSLRPSGTDTTNAARTSTGAISFMHRFSNSTREVAQNGRRGALMLSMDIKHPDVMDFIKVKRDLTQVTGANISVKLWDDFMKAVENGEDYWLRFPCNYTDFIPNDEVEYNILEPSINLNTGKTEAYVKRIKAKEYWNEIIESAHGVAEPGLMFWDNMVEYSPDGVYPQFRQITTNPCSEIAMQEYDACRLIAVNLFSFVNHPFTEHATFDFNKFYEINYEAMRLSDDLIDLELEHIDRILEKIENDPEDEETKRVEKNLWIKIRNTAKASRRTGLGFTALGDTLAALGIGYDQSESLEIIEMIMKEKMRSELDCTIDLAILRGTFEGCDWSKEFFHTMGKDQSKYEFKGNNNFYQFLVDKFPQQAYRMLDYGRRNVSWSTVAPTGTVSLMTQTTSGIEPLFQPFYIRRKKINPGEGNRVDFVDQNGDSWQEFPVIHPKFEEWIKVQMKQKYIGMIGEKELKYWFEKSPWYKSTANDIDWVKRVEIQAIIQKYITHSISSTINLPTDVKKEEVSKIYMESWKKGLKGITVYRDGSRSGVLVTKSDKFEYKDAVKRPKELKAETYVTSCKGENYTVIIGLYDDKPYEVFIDNSDNKYSSEGRIVKKARGKYIFKNGGPNIDIRSFMSDEEEAITRLVSANLRHGTDIKFIVEQLQKTNGDLFSFTKGVARILKKYIPNGAKSTLQCSECSSKNVIFEEGCNKCLDCANSKCS